MRAMSANSFQIANSADARSFVASRTNVRGNEQSCGKVRTAVQFTKDLMLKAQLLFPNKVSKEVAGRARCTPRNVDYWKAGRPIAFDDFFALLDSKEGTEFLDVFWEHVPMVTRERWLQQKMLSEKLRAAEAKLAAGKKQADQLRLQLKST